MKRTVALIGCGMIANCAHIPAFRRMAESFEIVAVCDLREDAARDTAAKYDIPAWYTDERAMLEAVHPEVVVVCSPNGQHKEHVMLALSHGAHVLCEKPIATTYADAAEMYGFAKERGLLLVACQCWRYIPERLAAKKAIDDGQIGPIYYGEMTHIRRRGIPTWGKFHIKEFSGGGAFLDIGVHVLDSALWLMGNPAVASVSAAMHKVHTNETGSLASSGALTAAVSHARPFDPEEMDVESFSSGTVRFQNGASLTFKVAWAANMAEENTLRLSGQKGGVDTEKGVLYAGKNGETPLAVEPERFPDEAFYGHFYIVENLAAALDGREELLIRPEESVNVCAVLEAAYRSAELGREVLMEEITGSAT